jgi:hypothetical protein
VQVNTLDLSATVYPFVFFGSSGDDGASVTTALASYNVVYLEALTYTFNTTPSVAAGQVVYTQPGTVIGGTAGFNAVTPLGGTQATGVGTSTPRSGVLAATLPRINVTVATAGLTTSGSVYMTAINLPTGLKVSNIAALTGTGTLKTSGTHGWYVLCDNNRVVRAATADQVDAATVWGVASTEYPLAIANAGGASATSFTTTYTGLHYIGFMVANTAGSQPNMTANATLAAGTGLAPIPCGVSATVSQTTAPATDGTVTIGAITFDATKYFYLWVT